jgi:hypothetical protein
LVASLDFVYHPTTDSGRRKANSVRKKCEIVLA